MNRSYKAVVCAVALAIVGSGCATERRWGACALGGGLLGATMGGTGAGIYRHNSDDDIPSDQTVATAAAIGSVTGGLIGMLLGHYICDPVEEPVAQAAPPPPPAPPPSGTEIAELRGTHFAFDSARLTPEGEAILDEATSTMNQHGDIRIRIEGHTDSVGSDDYNLRLGQRRADAAERYLVSRGIDATRLSTVSFGESKPAASNDTAEGRAENRRVELIVE